MPPKIPTTFLDLRREIRQQILSSSHDSHLSIDKDTVCTCKNLEKLVKKQEKSISVWFDTISKVYESCAEDMEFVKAK